MAAVHVYDSFDMQISSMTSSFFMGLYRPTQMTSSVFCGFIAQLVRASQRYRKVITSNLVEVLNFSSSQSFAQFNINCDDQS